MPSKKTAKAPPPKKAAPPKRAAKKQPPLPPADNLFGDTSTPQTSSEPDWVDEAISYLREHSLISTIGDLDSPQIFKLDVFLKMLLDGVLTISEYPTAEVIREITAMGFVRRFLYETQQQRKRGTPPHRFLGTCIARLDENMRLRDDARRGDPIAKAALRTRGLMK